MPYKQTKYNYKCSMDMENPIHKQILEILIRFLGEPKQAGDLHPFLIFSENKKYDGYQIRVLKENMKALRDEIEKLGIDFDNCFEIDWRHFHVNCTIEDIEYEGVAREIYNGWKLFYEIDGKEVFVRSISNEEIEKLEDMSEILKEWIQKHFPTI